MKWLKKLLVSKSESHSSANADDIIAEAKAMIAESKKSLQGLDAQINELNNLAPEELAWAAWFMALPENHKRIVEICGENGIKATPENFDSIIKVLVDQGKPA